MLLEHKLRFRALGSDVHLLAPETKPLQEAQDFLTQFEKTLSRFMPCSELSLLNQNPERSVSVSPLLERALRAARETAERSNGLIDPTLLAELQKAGYVKSWQEDTALSFKDLLRIRPSTKPAAPSKKAAWKQINFPEEGSVERPPGMQIDLGGIGKGLAADMIAEMWQSLGTWCVSIGGDMRLGGIPKREIIIDSPMGKRSIWISEGAVASSGVWRRAWLADSEPRNHLLDPSSGEPVWGPYAQATALAPTALEAERRAKESLLLGSEAPLCQNGGLLLDWQGEWKELG